MTFDLIIANSPYGNIGVNITKNIIKQNPDSNYAMLGTRSMFKPFYADTLACAFVQIGRYELGSNTKLDWGVEQAILLATNGWTEVVDNRKKGGGNKVGIGSSWPNMAGYSEFRSSHLVGVDRPRVDHTGSMGRSRTSHLVGINHMSPNSEGFLRGRTSHLVVAPGSIARAAWNHRTRSTTLVQVNKSDDTKLRNGYIYVAFETFEEACECAVDIISWTNPTDSHYRCVRWGFVCGLVPHYK